MAISRARTAVLILALLGAPLAAAEEWPGESFVNPTPEAGVAERLSASAAAGLEPLVLLPPSVEAEPSEVQALELFNATRPPKVQNGFSRSATPRRIRLAGDAAADGATAAYAGGLAFRDGGSLVWSGKLVVQEAYAVRVRLDDVEVPRKTLFRVYSESGAILGPFGTELLDADGGLWLPAVEGSTVFLEVRVPEETLGSRPAVFTVGEVMEIFDVSTPDFDAQVWTDCDIDGTCVGSGTLGIISNYRQAVARLSYVDGGFSFLCSGGLVNDQDTSGFRPFLLTANHCFSSQSSASSLTAYFDYHTATCNGSTPSLASVPQVSGSTLLASNSESDFTFVELSANPSGSRTYLGWTTATPSHGQTLYRLSHPAGTPQKFSTQEFLATGGITCGGLPRPDFHYSEGLTGSTTGGSSGAPVINSIGQIVGQLFGVCRFSSWDDCSYSTYNYVDGAFGTTFGYISSWLTDTGGGCTDDGFEEDDTCFGSFISLGIPQVHQHCDEDWVWFSATAGATYVIETSSLSAGSDTTLALHRSCGSQLAFDDDGGAGLASRIQFTASVSDSHDVRIRQFADSYESGEEYTVTVTCIAGCGGGGGATIFSDGFESGNLSAWDVVVP